MSESVIVRGPGEGRTLLVGGGDRVTYKVRSAETDGSYFCFEVSTTPGFGPPLHTHSYRELFYVLEGEYEFTIERDGKTETITGTALEEFFEDFGAPVDADGNPEPPDFPAMAAALERNGVHIVGAPAGP
jgi:hypothetical protein